MELSISPSSEKTSEKELLSIILFFIGGLFLIYFKNKYTDRIVIVNIINNDLENPVLLQDTKNFEEKINTELSSINFLKHNRFSEQINNNFKKHK